MPIGPKRFNSPGVIFSIFAIAVFFYLRFRIDPSLYVIAQEPVFQCKVSFFADYLSFPGGIIEYLSAFLVQFFIYPSIGAAVIALLLFSIACGTLRLLRIVGVRQGRVTLSLFPVVFCLALQGNYSYPLSITVGYVLALWTSAAYLGSWPSRFRLTAFLVLACALYYVAGGCMLLFALIICLHEILFKRRLLAGCICGIIAAVLPYVAAGFVFLISLHDAYLHTLPSSAAFFALPALLAVIAVRRLFARAAPEGAPVEEKKSWHSRLPLSDIIAGSALIALLSAFVVPSRSRIDQISLRFLRMSGDGEWERIYHDYLKSSLKSRVMGFVFDEALYYGGGLPSDLFSMPQHFGDQVLLLYGAKNTDPFNQDPFFFIYRSELYCRLGLVNEAEQWAYESIGLRGETAGALKRLALIHAAKGEIGAARICLSLLETMPLSSSWARQFRRKIADSSTAAADPEIRELRLSMPFVDYIRRMYSLPCVDLEATVRQNPHNRMAFEYCMAAYLLQGNIRKVASLADNLVPLGYPVIPRPYEEALVMLAASEPASLPAVAKAIDPRTITDYVSFNHILMNYHGDFKAAERELFDRFGGSYWYYCYHDLLPGKRK